MEINNLKNAIQQVINGGRTQYLRIDGRKIRVSNHFANPDRMEDSDLSFVVKSADYEIDKEYGSLTKNKKKFTSIPNQYFLNEYGEPFENFESVEKILEYNDINF